MAVTPFVADKIVVKQLVVKNKCEIQSAITLASTLAVTGATTLTGAVSMASTLAVTGAVTMASTLAITGNTTVGGTLGVTGAVSMASTLAVTGASTLTGNVSMGGTLEVTGATTLTGAVSMASTLGVTGKITADGGIDIPATKVLDVLGEFHIGSVQVTADAGELNKLDGIAGALQEVFEADFEADGEGTYTAEVTIPAGAVVLDVRWMNSVLWDNATSAGLKVGDGNDDDGYFTGVDLKSAPVADVNGAGGISSFKGDTGAGAFGGLSVSYPTGGTISAVVTTVGAGSAGRSKLVVLLANPVAVTVTKA